MKTPLIILFFLSFQVAGCQVKKAKHKAKPDESITITIDMSKDTPMHIISNSPKIIVDPHVTVSHDTAEIAKIWRQVDSMNLADSLKKLKK